MHALTPLITSLYVFLTLLPAGGLRSQTPEETLDQKTIERFANLALNCLNREYPNKISHVLRSDTDVRPPRELTPIFFGCYDWHSSVHGHWLLARLCRLYPEAPFVGRARELLASHFVAEKVTDELSYLRVDGRAPFERPYGLAWLLQLVAELYEWEDDQAHQWGATLRPLETFAIKRLSDWLPKLTLPVRTGEHSQTAFALGLCIDAARSRGHSAFEALLIERARSYYQRDRGWRLPFEPSGEDFLSPGLGEADLMRRVLDPQYYSAWLSAFLPDLRFDVSTWLEPAAASDRTDGKLAHLDGLNLSRAWMLEGIASGLPRDDPRVVIIRTVADKHRVAGLAAVTGEHYEGGHWLGSFAVYLVTKRGTPR